MTECYFISSKGTTSATICAKCGKEKMLHTIGDGIKASTVIIFTDSPKAPEQGGKKELTPMAQAIAHFNSLSDRVVLSHKQVAYILGQFLEAERKMAETIVNDCHNINDTKGFIPDGSVYFTTKYRQAMKEILPGYFYVPIPEGATDIQIHVSCITYYQDGVGTSKILLPGFTILFTRDEATEEKWKGVVKRYEQSIGYRADGDESKLPKICLYRNYKYEPPVPVALLCNTALESGASLLRSHNLPVEDNFVIVKREKL